MELVRFEVVEDKSTARRIEDTAALVTFFHPDYPAQPFYNFLMCMVLQSVSMDVSLIGVFHKCRTTRSDDTLAIPFDISVPDVQNAPPLFIALKNGHAVYDQMDIHSIGYTGDIFKQKKYPEDKEKPRKYGALGV